MLATLRETVARLERASLEGDDVALLFARQRRIEQRSASASQRAEGDFAEVPRFPSPAELREAIGERVLVEYVEHDGRLHAVYRDPAPFKLWRLGSAHQVAAERFHAAVRAASPGPSP